MHPLPFLQQPANDGLSLVVNRHLLLGHRHHQVLVLTLRHLQVHLFLGAADEDIFQLVLDFVEIFVAYRRSLVVGDDMAVAEEVERPEAELVNELDNGEELLQSVLQGCSRENHRIARLDFTCRLRYLRVPVLQSLHLVDYHHIRLQPPQHFDVIAGRVVRNDLEQFGRIILGATLQVTTLYDMRFLVGEMLYLALPLVFQRGGTKHQNGADESLVVQQYCCADSLNGLTEAHLVGNDGATGGGSEAYAFLLIGIECGVEQMGEVVMAQRCHPLPTLCSFPRFQHEVERIVVALHRIVYGDGALEEGLKVVKALWQKLTLVVEILRSQLAERCLMVAADADADLTAFGVVDINRSVGRRLTMHVAATVNPALHGLKMLAGTEL